VAHDIDLALVRAFLAVVDTGSVTAAARLLNRTQSAISLQIKRLEDFFSCELFERQHRKLILTPMGEQLLGRAQRLVQLNDHIWGELTTPAFEGEVRLGVPDDLIACYVPQILRRFNQAWPRVSVSLTCSNSKELLEDLDAGRVDLTLTTDQEPLRACETLWRSRLVWIGAAGSNAHACSPLPLAIGGRNCRFRPVLFNALSTAGREWRVVLEQSNQEAVYATVAAGIAVSVALRDTVPAHLMVLGPGAGLPELPEFGINLSLPAAGASETAVEMARHIRAEFAARFGLPPDTKTDIGEPRRIARRAAAITVAPGPARRMPISAAPLALEPLGLTPPGRASHRG
jgi:DNA-binding transcriptional LysR family regulator